MEINYYRQNNAQGYDEAWSACQFTSNTDLSKPSKESNDNKPARPVHCATAVPWPSASYPTILTIH